MIWLVFAVLTGVAVLAVLWPLVRAPRTVARQDADVAFYEAQIAEIGRDAERGLIAAEDAASAKAEAARRLIAVGGEEHGPSGPLPGSADAGGKVRALRRAIAAGLAIVFVPAIAFGMYRLVGNPDLPDEPLTARLDDGARPIRTSPPRWPRSRRISRSIPMTGRAARSSRRSISTSAVPTTP